MTRNIENYALIPHVSAAAILLFEGLHGWSLPCHQAENVQEISQALKDLLDVDTTVLYCAYDRYPPNDESEITHCVYAHENHSSDWQPPTGGRWITVDELVQLTLIEDEHRAVIESWFCELDRSAISKLRRPWQYQGWFDRAGNWLVEQAKHLDYQQIGAIEQVSSEDWSCVLRMHTNQGYLYFKAADPIFMQEPRLTLALAEIDPRSFPQILIVDHKNGWMLMRAFSTVLREREDLKSDPQVWKRLLKQFAELQIKVASHIDALIAVDCPDWRLQYVPTLFAKAFVDFPTLLVEEKEGITREEFTKLSNIHPELVALCNQLDSYKLPASIHHDDLHGGNIAFNGQQADEFIFFDWAESGISHPFCSMVVVLRVFKYACQFDQTLIEELRDAYLQPWTCYEPIERLRTAFELAQTVGKLLRALTWYRFIVSTEPRFRQRYAANWPYWLQVFLNTQD